ncbi:hypothetical protein CNMCM5623_002007 [Aspergillus felis]|uniref:Uncharacterized protein n=1 Tax=Aspergillus felis TaxID=1287682 RepID=A0A8H6UJY3_9EURO|nr:hypothetical protein CNMCM5623_002007 [Aspergillus felis]
MGNQISRAADAVKNGVVAGANAVANAGKDAGNAIADTGTKAGSAVVDGAKAAGEALDPEREKQRQHMAEAQQKWTELDQTTLLKMNVEKDKAGKEVEQTLQPIRQQASDFKTKLSVFLTNMANLQHEWQDSTINSYNTVLEDIADGLAGLTRVAMVLRGHSVESIRDAKIEKSMAVNPNDYLMTALSFTQSSFQSASQESNNLLDTVASISTQVRDLDQGAIPRFMADMTNFGKVKMEDIDGLKSSASTAQDTIDKLNGLIQQQKQEISDHLHMNLADDMAGIGKAFLGLFGQSFPDDWDRFLQSHYQNISNYDTQIVEQTKVHDIAFGIVDAANPIINDVNNLNAETDALRNRIINLMPHLQDLKVHLNDIHIQVDEIVEAFSTITESKHFDMSTDRYVLILVGVVSSTVKIDACCRSAAEWLVGQVRQIPVTPKTGSTLLSDRGNVSSGKTTTGDAAAWEDWTAALALPSPCALPSVDGLSHQHNFPGILSRFEKQKQETALAEQTGFDKIYEP